MSDLDDKLGAILGNPQIMQQIMSMASALGAQGEAAEKSEAKEASSPLSIGLDPGLLRQLGGLAGQSAVDQDQRTLLSALKPYLSHDRIDRLEKAMRAAKLARVASTFLNQGGLNLLSGR